MSLIPLTFGGCIAAIAATVEGLVLAQEAHCEIDVDVIQLPSSVVDFANPEMNADIERVKLMKMVWDAIGSEFSGQHAQYEMFNAGAPFVTKGHIFRNYDFAGAGRRLLDARFEKGTDSAYDRP